MLDPNFNSFIVPSMHLSAATSHNALIVEGGAMRSVFSAGLLDGFLEQKFNPFDVYFGVSAGAYNLATYLAGNSGQSLKIFLEFALHKRFISYSRFIRGGHLLDLDWLFEETLTDYHLNLPAIYARNKSLYVGVTDVHTGEAAYINTAADNLKQTIKASTALPLLYRGFPVLDGRPMTDGGVADGIPVAEAIRLGAKRIMVVRSRHKDYLKKDTLGHRYIRWKLRKHLHLTATMQERVSRHQRTINLIRNPPHDVKIVEICPPETFAIGRFNRSKVKLLQGYEIGFDQAQKAIKQWTALLEFDSTSLK